MVRLKYLVAFCLITAFSVTQFSCRNVRIKDHPEWKQYFDAYQGIDSACFEMYDNNKEIALFFNKERCSKRMIPGGEFDIFSAMAALSSNVALNEQFKLAIKDSSKQTTDTLTLTEAFKQENNAYFSQLSQVVGSQKMKQYLDTVQYGNRKTGNDLTTFFNDGTLLVTPDEMVGFMKRLYHGELPSFDQRSIRLVRDMMLQESKPNLKRYYRYATIQTKDTTMHWLIGFVEHTEQLKNPTTKKMEAIPHPYFFAMNFTTKDTSKDWKEISIKILNDILKAEHVND